jgi:hypothetical protein
MGLNKQEKKKTKISASGESAVAKTHLRRKSNSRRAKGPIKLYNFDMDLQRMHKEFMDLDAKAQSALESLDEEGEGWRGRNYETVIQHSLDSSFPLIIDPLVCYEFSVTRRNSQLTCSGSIVSNKIKGLERAVGISIAKNLEGSNLVFVPTSLSGGTGYIYELEKSSNGIKRAKFPTYLLGVESDEKEELSFNLFAGIESLKEITLDGAPDFQRDIGTVNAILNTIANALAFKRYYGRNAPKDYTSEILNLKITP